MTPRIIWIIFRKELTDTLRDRRTLIFMLLIPTLALPGLILGITRVTLHIQKKLAVETVKVAADRQTRENYARLVHGWFLSTGVADGPPEYVLRMLSPFVDSEALRGTDLLPEALFTDPAAFDLWMHKLTRAASRILTVMDVPRESPNIELPAGLREQVFDFYRVVVRGLGLIDFVDPASLPVAPKGFESAFMPQRLRALPRAKDIAWAIKNKRIHGYLRIRGHLDRLESDDDRDAEITLFHDSTIGLSRQAYKRIQYAVRKAGEALVQKRLVMHNLPTRFVQPLTMSSDADLATIAMIALNLVGGFLPYMIVAFAFLGAVYPAIDLGAGEKERHTLETLLLAPSARTEIAVGKLLVIFLAAVVAAALGTMSIVLSIGYVVPPIVLERLDFHIEPAMVGFVALLVLPLALGLSAIFLAISVGARSFKEAQNYIAPLQFIVIIPALAPMIPGLEMSWKLALIPFVNVSMLATDFIKGDANWFYYGITLLSTLALSALCVAFAVRRFSRETVLFRS